MTDTSPEAAPKKGRVKPVPAGGKKRLEREPVIPLMLRPEASQKACAERVAEQLEIKRSRLDPQFYLRGALLTAVEKLGKEELLGTWTRKEVAAFLKEAFTPLFELLYEQGELPLVFTLLFTRGVPSQAFPSEVSTPLASPALRTQSVPPATREQPAAETALPALSADAEVGLDGFPAGI